MYQILDNSDILRDHFSSHLVQNKLFWINHKGCGTIDAVSWLVHYYALSVVVCMVPPTVVVTSLYMPPLLFFHSCTRLLHVHMSYAYNYSIYFTPLFVRLIIGCCVRIHFILLVAYQQCSGSLPK